MARNRHLFTLGEFVSWTGGTITGAADAVGSAGVTAVCVDSRACTSGSLFVALPGERTDGHRFVADAAQRGATAVVVEQPVDAPEGIRVVRVENSLVALQLAAKAYLDRFPDVIRVGVTGSNGKTTTKEMIHAILRGEMRAYATPGNLNSDCGLPLAVFQMPPDTEIAVFEMGMNRPDEIEELAEICRPDLAVITNIGTAHIGMLGSTDNIAAEKKKIASRFTGRQVLFVPDDDKYADYLSKEVNGEVVRFGYRAFRAEYRETPTGAEVHLPQQVLRIPVPGYFNGANALAALAVAQRLNVGATSLQRGLAHMTLPEGRTDVSDGDRLVFNDSYNANPQSMIAALDAFLSLAKMRDVDDTMVIVGEMGELGEHARSAHVAVLDYVLRAQPGFAVFVGAEFEAPVSDAPTSDTLLWFADVESAREAVKRNVRDGQAIFVKGSRAVGLEAILDIVTGSRSGEVCRA